MDTGQFVILVIIASIGGALGPWVRRLLVKSWTWFICEGRSIVLRILSVAMGTIFIIFLGIRTLEVLDYIVNMSRRLLDHEERVQELEDSMTMNFGGDRN